MTAQPVTAQPVTAVLDTPAGPLALVLDAGSGAVLASGFGPLPDLVARRGLPVGQPADLPPASDGVLGPVADAVQRYFAGDVDALDEVAVDQPGTEFQQRVWAELRRIPAGEPVSYGALVSRVGSGSARSVGQACGRNLAAPFVPCHRVVPAGGGVGGYAYGADVKTQLLDLERTQR